MTTAAVKMVSYWTPPVPEWKKSGGIRIRHTSHADTSYLATCQDQGIAGGMPSASVWIIPATDIEDPDYERSPVLDGYRRRTREAYWLADYPDSMIGGVYF